jgi:hypothetical protein
VDDRERAHKYLTDEFAMKGGIVGQRDEDVLAAEFAAVREPLERRVAQLEAALRDAIKMPPHRSNLPRYVIDMANTLAAALAGAPEREETK